MRIRLHVSPIAAINDRATINALCDAKPQAVIGLYEGDGGEFGGAVEGAGYRAVRRGFKAAAAMGENPVDKPLCSASLPAGGRHARSRRPIDATAVSGDAPMTFRPLLDPLADPAVAFLEDLPPAPWRLVEDEDDDDMFEDDDLEDEDYFDDEEEDDDDLFDDDEEDEDDDLFDDDEEDEEFFDDEDDDI